MLKVTSEWLNDRGNLYDATVTHVRIQGTTIEVAINDEWFNSRGFDRPEGEASPGALILEDCSALQRPASDAAGGWLDAVNLQNDELDLQFCDWAPISLRMSAVWWRSSR